MLMSRQGIVRLRLASFELRWNTRNARAELIKLIRVVKESLVIFHVCAGNAIVEGVAYRLFSFSFSQDETFQLSSIGSGRPR